MPISPYNCDGQHTSQSSHVIRCKQTPHIPHYKYNIQIPMTKIIHFALLVHLHYLHLLNIYSLSSTHTKTNSPIQSTQTLCMFALDSHVLQFHTVHVSCIHTLGVSSK
eukprot:620145_1